jgi:hypothetical protein
MPEGNETFGSEALERVNHMRFKGRAERLMALYSDPIMS